MPAARRAAECLAAVCLVVECPAVAVNKVALADNKVVPADNKAALEVPRAVPEVLKVAPAVPLEAVVARRAAAVAPVVVLAARPAGARVGSTISMKFSINPSEISKTSFLKNRKPLGRSSAIPPQSAVTVPAVDRAAVL